jgi:hypothetical protein
MKQYYHIKFTSEFLYNDDKKIIVNSRQELKEYIKRDMDYMMDYFNNPKYDNNKDDEWFNQEKKDKVKKIYKRIRTSGMFVDLKNRDTPKRVGVCYSIEYRPTEKYQEQKQDYGNYDLMTYWCSRIPKNHLINYTGFEQI